MDGGSANGPPTTVPGTRFGRLWWFDEIDSTNRWLADRARAGEPDGTVAIARYQSAGRGRLDRRWEAPPDSALLLSALVRPVALVVPVDRWHLLTVALALAVVDAAESFGAAGVALKWPNDVVVPARGDRKLAGILCEVVAGAVVAGVGVNRVRPLDAPPVLAERAVWLADLMGDRPAPGMEALAEAVLRAFDAQVTALEGSPGALLDRYRARCVTIGRHVRVHQPGGDVVGTALAVDHDGHLVVGAAGAPPVTVTAGDVVHVRPLG